MGTWCGGTATKTRPGGGIGGKPPNRWAATALPDDQDPRWARTPGVSFNRLERRLVEVGKPLPGFTWTGVPNRV